LENEKELAAYHESARIVFAYLNGYKCDLMEVPAKGSNSSSRLNAGNDARYVQAILSGNVVSLSTEDLPNAIVVARKLMVVYCAGTCAKIFLQNDLKVPGELEVDIDGQDLVMLEKIQGFLKKSIRQHPDDFPSAIIVSIFKKLKEPAVWKAVELLVSKVLNEGGSLKRFYIEDTLMMAGIEIQRAAAQSGFGVGVHEENEGEHALKEQNVSSFKELNSTPLDVMVTDFLRKIKSNWQEEELTAATQYLHSVYKKYG
jgi:hypothetical protein